MSTRKSTNTVEFPAFSQQLVNLSQFKPRRKFESGSTAEIEGCNGGIELAGLSSDSEDVDYMLYSVYHYVFPRKAPVPAAYKEQVIRYDTAGKHPGYAKLVNEKDKTTVHGSQEINHGPALMECVTTDMQEEIERCRLTNVVTLEGYVSRKDTVEAYHCPYWPKEASEWITRKRLHGSPSKSLMKKVISYGCDFVCVSHKLKRDGKGDRKADNDKKNEWRFSFSHAELIIIKSWSIAQRNVYRTLRVIFKKIDQDLKKDNIDGRFCTYYFKTLMLWGCEQVPADFWETGLAGITHRLLDLFCHWLEVRCIRNYFIPSNNMIDHLTDSEIFRYLKILQALIISQNRPTAADLHIPSFVEKCDLEREEMYSRCIVQVELPTWLNTSLVLGDRIENVCDTYKDLFNNDYSQQLQDAVHAELSDIYQGLRYHKLSVVCDTMSEREDYWHRARQHFSAATSYWQSKSRVQVDSGFDFSMPSLLYFKLKPEVECPLPYSITIAQHYIYPEETHITEYFFNSPYRSPTVNIAWFISKVYLANFLYTVMHDYEETVRICEEVIDKHTKPKGNRWFAENAFRFVISSSWAQIYDDDIQALLGFYSLCLSLSKKSIKPNLVYFTVCPVQFALYLKLRCALDQRNSSSTMKMIFDSCVRKFEEHAHSDRAQYKGVFKQNSKFVYNISMVLDAKLNPISVTRREACSVM